MSLFLMLSHTFPELLRALHFPSERSRLVSDRFPSLVSYHHLPRTVLDALVHLPDNFLADPCDLRDRGPNALLICHETAFDFGKESLDPAESRDVTLDHSEIGFDAADADEQDTPEIPIAHGMAIGSR